MSIEALFSRTRSSVKWTRHFAECSTSRRNRLKHPWRMVELDTTPVFTARESPSLRIASNLNDHRRQAGATAVYTLTYALEEELASFPRCHCTLRYRHYTLLYRSLVKLRSKLLPLARLRSDRAFKRGQYPQASCPLPWHPRDGDNAPQCKP